MLAKFLKPQITRWLGVILIGAMLLAVPAATVSAATPPPTPAQPAGQGNKATPAAISRHIIRVENSRPSLEIFFQGLAACFLQLRTRTRIMDQCIPGIGVGDNQDRLTPPEDIERLVGYDLAIFNNHSYRLHRRTLNGQRCLHPFPILTPWECRASGGKPPLSITSSVWPLRSS